MVREGVNPSDIAKAIRSDNIEKLQEISSQKTLIISEKLSHSIKDTYL